MSADERVRVERARARCPFCRDEVVSGVVWLCPGCAASHHADCAREHGACAACGHAARDLIPAPAVVVPAAPARVTPRAVDEWHLTPDQDLAMRGDVLASAGFAVHRPGAGLPPSPPAPAELRAIGESWRYDPWAAPLPHVVHVTRAAGRLSAADLDAALARGAEEARRAYAGRKAERAVAVVMIVADSVDPAVVWSVRAGEDLAWRAGILAWPVLWRSDVAEAVYCAGSPLLARRGLLLLGPGLRYLSRRLCFPYIRGDAIVEPTLGRTLLVWTALASLLVLVLIVVILAKSLQS